MREDGACSEHDSIEGVEHLWEAVFQVCVALSLERHEKARRKTIEDIHHLHKTLIWSAATGSAVTVAAVKFAHNAHPCGDLRGPT